MKISINDQKIYELSETKQKVIKDDIAESIFLADMKRRLEWVLMHKYEQCFKKLHEEWLPKLATRMDAVPTDPDKFAELVFSQSDYKDSQKKIDEAKHQEHLRRTGQL